MTTLATEARCRVLLADDTPEIRMLVRMALELEGSFDVVGEAADGAEAVSLAGDFRPDAIVLDLAMPVMDGLEAIPQLKLKMPQLKILVLSGFQASRMEAEAIAAGADAYLEKGEPASKIVMLLKELCPAESLAGTEVSMMTARIGPPPETELSEDIFSTLAHELMTPVTVIQGFAETMAERLDDLPSETITEWATTIARNASNMAAIIRSFQETSKLEAGDVQLALEPVSLKQLVEETVIDLGALTAGREVIVTAPDDVVVIADHVKIRQIVSNLISNAVKFSPRGTPIEIATVKGAFYGEVCIGDHGRGVAQDQRNELFHKFSRLEAPEPGSGLGLYICRRLARAHGGDVIYKDGDDGGSTFCLRLPLPA